MSFVLILRARRVVEELPSHPYTDPSSSMKSKSLEIVGFNVFRPVVRNYGTTAER
jgi:hypothetical protein